MADAPRSPFEILGEDGVRRIVDRFYDLMDSRPDAAGIRAMHAKKLDPMRDRLAVFLTGWMGGPSLYTERFGPTNVPSAHAPFDIGEAERDAWIACMQQAVDESDLPPDWAGQVMAKMRGMAEMCRTLDADGSVRPVFAGIRSSAKPEG